MARFFAALVCVATLATPALADDWPVARLARSVFSIRGAEMQCSAVLVGENGIYLTAAHCAVEEMSIRGVPCKVLSRSESDDLAVFQAPSFNAPPMKVSKSDPKPGAEILQLGYGLNAPVVTPIPSLFIGPVGPLGAPPVVTAAGSLEGMSGGPIVNRRGEIVGLVSGVYDSPHHKTTDVVRVAVLRDAVKQWVK
jgi:S1-C subfamily serine protease